MPGVCIRVFSPPIFLGSFIHTLSSSGNTIQLYLPFHLRPEKKYRVMQLYAILLLTANLAVSALAAPIANTTNVTSSSCAPNFLRGTQVGEGGFINHSIHLGDIRFE